MLIGSYCSLGSCLFALLHNLLGVMRCCSVSVKERGNSCALSLVNPILRQLWKYILQPSAGSSSYSSCWHTNAEYHDLSIER